MPEFDLDNFKQTWQEEAAPPIYKISDIESMLNKSSRNYVKYILWISIAEFILIFGANLYYSFWGEDTSDLVNILQKLGIEDSVKFENTLSLFYLILKILSLGLTATFIYLFYRNYQKINVESNLKKLILQILKFKKTVQLFILANIVLVVIFTMSLGVFSLLVLDEQSIKLTNPAFTSFILSLTALMAVSVLIIWFYYRIVYGFILRKLGKNLAQLQNIEEGN